ncbi:Imm32 family immunity protein [Streptomyces sp. NBC_00208]|uniref:Imm32 family immunity protein n=1 Tax=Streptomyces sp. NBC_00208 TaxID=2975681 RepID=UPI003FA714C7
MDEPRIKVYGSATEITVAANAAGLRDLAERLMGLADPELRDGYHEHLEGGINRAMLETCGSVPGGTRRAYLPE